MSELLLFSVAFAFVSITPGMCMTLALTMGMTIGVARTRWMMLGELLGDSLIVIISSIGVAAIMLQYPKVFEIAKLMGGSYLLYIAFQLWCSKGNMSVDNLPVDKVIMSNYQLATQGFVTAITNPKGWIFFISLIPPFINPENSLVLQLIVFLSIIAVVELISLHIYAYGGHALKIIISKKGNVKTLNKISGTLMAGVAFWLVLGT